MVANRCRPLAGHAGTKPPRPACRVLHDGSGHGLHRNGHRKTTGFMGGPDPSRGRGIATLGPSPLDPGLRAPRPWPVCLQGDGRNIKNVLAPRSPSIAGIGNAYSDEALHRGPAVAVPSPARALGTDEAARLHDALCDVLPRGRRRARGPPHPEFKGDKKRSMRGARAHRRALPRLRGRGARGFLRRPSSLQYCATCQTGGKPLADRRLSRFVK